jgi:hypothetical protein
MQIDSGRVQTLIVGRAYALRKPASISELLAPLARFAPSHVTSAAWREHLETAIESLRPSVLDDDHLLIEPDELRRRIGLHNITSWSQLADRVLPGLGLDVPPNDTKTLGKLTSADAWAAAIVGRARGTWTAGPPPSPSALADAFAWERLGLTGRAKRLPAEVRSLFLQRELDAHAAKYERLLRQLAARELGVPRTDARTLREGLVRAWLTKRALGQQVTPSSGGFAADVVATARSARAGVFGERKVFISEVWQQLRARPTWSSLTLDEFKARLLAAHRAGDVELARADLVAAMNPEIVAASETLANGASFHFVVREAS